MTKDASYGQRLKQARIAAGLTQKGLGRLVGQAATTISNVEQGNSTHSTRTAALARVLGVRPEWLEEGRGPMLFDLRATNGMQLQRAPASAPAKADTIAFTRDDLDLAQQINRLPTPQRQAILAMLIAFDHGAATEQPATAHAATTAAR